MRPRHRCHWIVWLMLALLPLRGWGFAVMPMPQPALHAGQGAAALPPCHAAVAEVPHADGAMPQHHATALDDGSEPHDGSAPQHNCALCNICHGTAMPAALAAAPADAVVPGNAPAWRAPPAAEAEPQALFKPPRD